MTVNHCPAEDFALLMQFLQKSLAEGISQQKRSVSPVLLLPSMHELSDFEQDAP